MHISSALLLLASTLLPLASAATPTGTQSSSTAVASPDGVIVPFTSKLPACASLCGPLFNVQGACAPPVLTAPSQSCFCSSAVLTPFLQSTAEVAAVCGPESCQDTADLQEIQTWYAGFCNDKVVTPTTTAGSTSTATSTSTSTSTPAASKNQSWIATHYGWVIFVVVVTIALVGGWVLASFLRRRYLRRKEREIEMGPPITAWGPHQTQAMSGGLSSSEVALGAGGLASPLAKEAKPAIQDAGTGRGNRESKGWLRKERS